MKALISMIYEKFIRYKLFEELHADCRTCLINLDACEKNEEVPSANDG